MSVRIYSRDLLTKSKPHADFVDKNLWLRDHVREVSVQQNGHRVYEFIGTDTFGSEWNTRQLFEINAGRDEEPILYTPLYDEVRDANLPKNISVNQMGPGGVVFEEVFEGGEVKFSSVTSGSFAIAIRHWATGLEYSKDLVIYNELWNVPIIERQMGIAHNALLNDLHLSPIISYTYTAANQTGPNPNGDNLTEDYMLTIEDAITNARTDTTNPRRGPYVLLVSTANVFAVERALSRVPQVGIDRQAPSALSAIRSVIAYDGWTGTRGNKTTTYTGVTAGKGYLVSQQYRGQDFRSFVKQDLQNEGEERDLSRFLTQTVWDSYWGVYANPVRSVEEITFPS